MKWYYRRGSQEVGPIDTADLKKLVNRGELGPSDLVWHTEADEWMRVAQARKLLISRSNPQAQIRPQAAEADTEADEPETETPEDSPEPVAEADQPEAGQEPQQEPQKVSEPPVLRATDRPSDPAAPRLTATPSDGADGDVTADIVQRLRRRMVEISGDEPDRDKTDDTGAPGALAAKLAERAAALSADVARDRKEDTKPASAPPAPEPKPPSPPPAPQAEKKAEAPAEAVVEEEASPEPAEPEEAEAEAAEAEVEQAEAASAADSEPAPEPDPAASAETPPQDAPAKQVASPVHNQRLPPRALVAELRPPQSAEGSSKRPVRKRKDRLAKARRLGARRTQEAASEAEPPNAVAETAPPDTNTPDTAQNPAASARAQAGATNGSQAPEAATAEREAPNAAATDDAQPDAGPRSDSDPPPAPDPQPAPGSQPTLGSEPTPNRPTSVSRAAPAQRGPESSNTAERSPGQKRSPRDLARAAAEALRRERARGQGTPGAAKTGRPAPETAPPSPAVPEPEPDRPDSPEQPAPANVEPLIQPSTAPAQANQAQPSAVGDRPAELNRLPGRRGRAQPAPSGERSAVRSLPVRTGSTRKKGAAKNRRRDTNVVPSSRQTLSAQNETMGRRRSQGRYSLARSYWGHLVLGTLILAGAGAAGLWYFANQAQVFRLIALAAVLAVLIVVIAPWQIKGVWRSARNHIREHEGSIVARLAQASLFLFAALYIALFGALLIPVTAAANILLRGVDDRDFQVKLNAAGTIIQVDGEIDPGITAQIDDALRRSPRVHTLVLNSTGGYLFEARQLRDLVEASPIRATYTRTNCLGACVLPFMAADERVAEVGATLQFGGATGASGPLGLVDDRLGRNDDTAYLAERGLDPAQFANSRTEAYLSTDRHDALVEAGVLTAVSVGNRVFRSETISDVSKAQVERALLTVPFFATFRASDQDIFNAFRDGVAAINEDTENIDGLGAKTFDSAGPLIEHVKTTYLPVAPDRDTDDLMAVLAALGTEVREDSAQACVALVSPSLETLGQPIAPYLETDRRAAYFQVFDQLITAARDEAQPGLDQAQAAEIAAPVIETVAQGDAEIAAFLTEGAPGGLSAEQRCTAALDYLTGLRALPLADRSAAFRLFAVRAS